VHIVGGEDATSFAGNCQTGPLTRPQAARQRLSELLFAIRRLDDGQIAPRILGKAR